MKKSDDFVTTMVFREFSECIPKNCGKEMEVVNKGPHVAKMKDLTHKLFQHKISEEKYREETERIKKEMINTKEVKNVATCINKKCAGTLRKSINEFLKAAELEVEKINQKNKKTKSEQDLLDIVSKLKSVQSKLDDKKLTNSQRLAAIKNARS